MNPKEARISIRCSAEEAAAWEELANREGRSLANWIRRAINKSVQASKLASTNLHQLAASAPQPMKLKIGNATLSIQMED